MLTESGQINAARQLKLDQVRAALDALIDVKKCVLSFDKSLIEQLPDILVEQYGVRRNEDISKIPSLSIIMEWLREKYKRSISLSELPLLLVDEGLDAPRFHPKLATQSLPQEFAKWTTNTAGDDRDMVLALHKDLAMGTHNPNMSRYEPERSGQPLANYLGSITTPRPTLLERLVKLSFWELKIKLWMMRGLISKQGMSLSVGPRWLTEIRFFREIVGLHKHVGLDLFSDDPELVVAGDMHQMPFEANTFNFIFIKNTMDKSYNIRKLVTELVRTIRPKGIIAIDQICGHGAVSPIHRTDLQRAENLLLIFKAVGKIQPLVCRDIDVRKWSADGSSNNVRLAVQVLK